MERRGGGAVSKHKYEVGMYVGLDRRVWQLGEDGFWMTPNSTWRYTTIDALAAAGTLIRVMTEAEWAASR